MNINPNIETTAAQNARLLAWLLDGGTITALEAMPNSRHELRLNCVNLSGRISDLKKAGWIISDVWERNPLSNKRYKRYYIKPGDRGYANTRAHK